MITCDIAIVGSGFAGSIMAMIARRLGYSVVLIEKGAHPRVVIGESSTPLTNLLLEELSERYNLPALRPLTKWGTWQRTYPDVACGLKRGFTFYHHDLHAPAAGFPNRSEQLLVAASPHDEIADTHWYRADFDHFLVTMAQEMGVEYLDQTHIAWMTESSSGVRLEGQRKQAAIGVSAKLLIDATGPRGFLHPLLGIHDTGLPSFPNTQAIHSHFTGVTRLEQVTVDGIGEVPPYPVDDAAVHHVFEGGWVWVLQFNNGLTSAGVAALDQRAADLDFSDGEGAWRRLIAKIPVLESQFAHALPARPFSHIPRLSYCASAVTGERWAMLPSAAGFVDPLLSTGFPLTLLGILRMSEILGKLDNPEELAEGLQRYAAETRADLFTAAQLVSSLYATMGDFRLFSALSMLYFAAVSFTETARRLNRHQLAPGFLMRDHPIFAPSMKKILAKANLIGGGGDSDQLVKEIFEAIEPFDLAGLCDPGRRNWYPVDPRDLLRSASKVEATYKEIQTMLDRCGMQRLKQVARPMTVSD